jgi:hypothetical protein
MKLTQSITLGFLICATSLVAQPPSRFDVVGPPAEDSFDEGPPGFPFALLGQAAGGIFNAQVAPGPGGGVPNIKLQMGAGGGMRFPFGTPKEKPLYIPKGKAEENVRNEIEEDLTIMGKLLDDAISGEKEAHQAMGISVQGLFGGGAARQMHIEGFGAVFQANVRFPLAAPGARAESESTNSPSNSAWDEARQQIYGSSGHLAGSAGENSEYSVEKVEALKKSLLHSLANASNMRHLKPEESITVAVRGGGGDGVGHIVATAMAFASSPNGTAKVERTRSPEPSSMIIRVKKSDVDALAKAKITAEEFSKRAMVLFQ